MVKCSHPLFSLGLLTFLTTCCFAQEPSIVLPQGEFRGIRRPSSKKSTVVAFLGIPYAQPPVGPLRFRGKAIVPYSLKVVQLPEDVQPSNRTFQAVQHGPACPQPDLDRLRAAEDCLSVNVWIPEMPVDFQTYPVLVFLEGDMFSHGNPAKYPAEDLAAEGLVVVTINYRLNVFGFLSLESEEAPGNLGLWDQHAALRWVQNNIGRFGGDPKKVTLMGHGAGGASVVMHMISPRSKDLFLRAIIMSGSANAPWAISRRPRDAAYSIGALLGCRTGDSDSALLDCLRDRDVRDILQAFSRHQKDLNTTETFAPVVQGFLSPDKAFLLEDPKELLKKGDFPRLRIITGVAESEGASLLNVMRTLTRKNYDELTHWFLTASVPTVISQYNFSEARSEIALTLRYNYFDKAPRGDKAALLHQIIQFYSDAYYKAPHDQFIHSVMRKSMAAYVYRFAHVASGPFNHALNGTGTLHNTELLYLFGPTMYRQEIGVGFSRQDEAVSDLLKRMWFEFAQGGDPTPNSFGLKWEPSNKDGLKNYAIREQLAREPYSYHTIKFWNEYLPGLVSLARGEEPSLIPSNMTSFEFRFRLDPTQPYQSIMWVLIAAISVLLVAFILSLASMRRQRSLP